MARRRKPLRRKKQVTGKQNFMYFLLLLLLIVFFATIGVRLVINASIWISGINKDDTSVSQEDTDRSILFAPELYNIPEATNSALLKVEGSAKPGTQLTAYINGEASEELEPEEDGSFDVTIQLDDGENTFFIESKDEKAKQAKDSETYTVLVKRTKPTLSLESPQDNQTVDENTVEVAGTTDENTYIRINNLPLVYASNGSFQKSVRLQEGDNTIVIVATDIAGNTEQQEINVRYERD